MVPFSGRSRAEGYNALYGAKLAIQEWNEVGGVAGYPVELVAYDDRNEGAMAALQAQKMVIDPQVVGVVGHLTNPSALAAAEVYHQGGLAAMTLGATSDGLTAYPGFLRLVASDTDIARQLAQFIKGRFQRVAIVSQDPSSYLVTGLELALENTGVKVVGQKLLAADVTSYLGVVAELRQISPDLIIYSGSQVGAADFWAAAGASLSAAFLSSSASYGPDFVKIVGAVAEGTYYISLAPDLSQWPTASAFRARYRSLTGSEPDPLAALAYNATNGLLSVVEQTIQEEGGPRRVGVMRRLAQSRDYLGTIRATTLTEGKTLNPKIYIYGITGLAYPGQLIYIGQ
ncbi:MAG: branched-chain amino acid ABC transporter substrate-binding protein [Chloroflexi bacterium]|nr:branched-chain amino acid ABC transporter substrate-binding protein [Chloroflexota bacterium]